MVFGIFSRGKSRTHNTGQLQTQPAKSGSSSDRRYQDDDGKTGPPTWVDDPEMAKNFAAAVQILSAPDGLSPAALSAMFSLEQPLERAIAIAGAVERQGGSFKDQQVAVKNFMVRWWGELSPGLQESISQGFEYR
jgi:hypothetical protein